MIKNWPFAYKMFMRTNNCNLCVRMVNKRWTLFRMKEYGNYGKYRKLRQFWRLG